MAKFKSIDVGTNHHRYVPFRERIESVHVDPIRNLKVDRYQVDTAESHFMNALEKWDTLNLTENYVKFSRQCRPLAQSLPMILHNQERIVSLLLDSVKSCDQYSAEPMFDLIAQFAYDLGSDFEPYFIKTLNIFIGILNKSASSSPSFFEVVGQMYQCLAYLLKYLSRLLSKDLRPTFDLYISVFNSDISPSEHLIRFAAESMAFLIRRMKIGPLTVFLNHIFRQIEREDNQYYAKFCALLLAEAMRGANMHLHSKATFVLRSLLSSAQKNNSFLCRTLVQMIVSRVCERLDLETVVPFYDTILTFLFTTAKDQLVDRKFIYSLLYLLAGLEDGKFVTDWKRLCNILMASLEAEPPREILCVEGLKAVTAVCIYADIPALTGIMDNLFQLLYETESVFLVLSAMSSIDPLRNKIFRKLVLRSFDRSDRRLALLLLKSHQMVDGEVSVELRSYSTFSDVWWTLKVFRTNKPLRGLASEILCTDADSNMLAETLGELIRHARDEELYEVVRLVLSKLDKISLRSGLIDALKESFHKLQNVVTDLSIFSENIYSVIDCVQHSDAKLRAASCQFIDAVAPNDIIHECVLIDQIPRNILNERNVKQRLRQMCERYYVSKRDNILDAVVPRFLFSLLTERFSPISEAALNEMPSLAEKNSEGFVRAGLKWIRGRDLQTGTELETDIFFSPLHRMNDENKLQVVIETLLEEFAKPLDSLRALALRASYLPNSNNECEWAVKAFLKAPNLAELHGNEFVPLLLKNPEKNLFNLFATFIRPQMLDRMEEVYECCLKCLSDGDLEIQKASLLCLAAVAIPNGQILRLYTKKLSSFLNQHRMKDEIETFLAADFEGSLPNAHRHVVLPILTRLLYGRCNVVTGFSSWRHSVVGIMSEFEVEYQMLFCKLAAEQALAVDSSIGTCVTLLRLFHGLAKALGGCVKPLISIIVPSLLRSYTATGVESESDTFLQLIDFFTTCFEHVHDTVWNELYGDIYEIIVKPGLAAPSESLLKLFLAQARNSLTMRFLEYDGDQVFDFLIQCLESEALSRVKLSLEIFESLLELNCQGVLQIGHLVVRSLAKMLQQDFPLAIVSLLISVLNKMLDRLPLLDEQLRAELVNVSLAALRNSHGNGTWSFDILGGLFETVCVLVSSSGSSLEQIENAFEILAPFFKIVKNTRTRKMLARCYTTFGNRLPRCARVAGLINLLNADEELTQLECFGNINDKLYKELDHNEWLVVVHNALFYMSSSRLLRTAAACTLRRLLCAGETEHAKCLVLPDIYSGLRLHRKSQRAPYISVLEYYASSSADLGLGIQPISFVFSELEQHNKRAHALDFLNSVSVPGEIVIQYIYPLLENLVVFTGDDSEAAGKVLARLSEFLSYEQYASILLDYVDRYENDPARYTALLAYVARAASAQTKQIPKASGIIGRTVESLQVISEDLKAESSLERIKLMIPIAYLLTSLPVESVDRILPGRMMHLGFLLKSKNSGVRKTSGLVLAEVIRIMGPKYIPVAIAELCLTLQECSAKPVLCTTVDMLLGAQQGIEHGDLDSCTSHTGPLVADLDCKDQKQLGHCFSIATKMAANISLQSFGLFFEPLRKKLLKTKLNSRKRGFVEKLLDSILLGLEANSEYKTQNCMILAYQLYKACTKDQAEEKLRQERATGGDFTDLAQVKQQAAKESEEFFTVRLSSRGTHELSESSKLHVNNLCFFQSFSLGVLAGLLKQDSLKTAANLRGLLGVLEDGIKSTHSNIQLAAFQLLSVAVQIPIPDRKEWLFSSGQKALDILKSVNTASDPLSKVCLQFLTSLLNFCPEFTMSDEGYQYLLNLVLPDVQDPERQECCLEFVAAVLRRKVMLPQVYDLLDTISHVMIQNMNDGMRRACRSVYLEFILKYPQGKTRFDQCIGFLVAQLDYPSAPGRNSAIEMLRMVVGAVPNKMLASLATSIFAGIALVIINDDNQDCRASAQQLLAELLRVSDQATRGEMVGMVKVWLESSNPALIRGGLQVAAAFVPFGLHQRLSKRLEQIAQSILADAHKSASAKHWQQPYYAIEYLLQLPAASLNPDIVWLVEPLVEHGHPEVRAQATRVFTSWFSELKRRNEEDVLVPEKVLKLTSSFTRQLAAPGLAQKNAVQVVRALVFLVLRAEALGGAAGAATQTLVHEASKLLCTDACSRELLPNNIAAVQLLGALAQLLPVGRLSAVAPGAVRGLYVLENLEAKPAGADQLPGLAGEALRLYETALGTTKYLRLYAAVQNELANPAKKPRIEF